MYKYTTRVDMITCTVYSIQCHVLRIIIMYLTVKASNVDALQISVYTTPACVGTENHHSYTEISISFLAT